MSAGEKKPLSHKAKLHPFDFSSSDLARIRTIFPEFLLKRNVKKSSNKVQGLLVSVRKHIQRVQELIKHLKEVIQLDGKGLSRLARKLDHRGEDKVNLPCNKL